VDAIQRTDESSLLLPLHRLACCPAAAVVDLFPSQLLRVDWPSALHWAKRAWRAGKREGEHRPIHDLLS
jgi:hypothetical protein